MLALPLFWGAAEAGEDGFGGYMGVSLGRTTMSFLERLFNRNSQNQYTRKSLDLEHLEPRILLSGATWHVDDVTDPLEDGTLAHPFDSIQEGIGASGNGDTVLVHTGLYTEWGINFGGKAITVTGEDPDDQTTVENTVVDGDQQGTVFVFSSGEGIDSVLTGLTIQNGQAE